MGTHARNGSAPDWSTDKSAAGRTMWKRGEPASYIGTVVGKTRNAVIGHAHRQGWGPHPNPQAYRNWSRA